jgi:hypothetical protein
VQKDFLWFNIVRTGRDIHIWTDGFQKHPVGRGCMAGTINMVDLEEACLDETVTCPNKQSNYIGLRNPSCARTLTYRVWIYAFAA